MTVQFYPNGAGGTLGDQIDTCKPLSMTGNIWYVNSVIGIDGASPNGQNREKPLQTLAQAIINSASGDMIVLLTGHSETLAAGLTLKSYTVLVGEGVALGKPSCRVVSNFAGGVMLTLSAGAEVRNVYFPEATQTTTGTKVALGSGARAVGCYFEQGTKDTGAACSIGTANSRFQSCTWIATGTSIVAAPLAVIKVGPATFDQLEMYDCVISAGTSGFSNYSAIDFTGGTITNCRIIGLSLLLGADVAMGATATGIVNTQLTTGGSRVSWS